jgi:hypothetical protein
MNWQCRDPIVDSLVDTTESSIGKATVWRAGSRSRPETRPRGANAAPLADDIPYAGLGNMTMRMDLYPTNGRLRVLVEERRETLPVGEETRTHLPECDFGRRKAAIRVE